MGSWVYLLINVDSVCRRAFGEPLQEISGVFASGAVQLRCVAVISGHPDTYPPPLDVAEEIKQRYARGGGGASARQRRALAGSSTASTRLREGRVGGQSSSVGASTLLDRAAALPVPETSGLSRFLVTQEGALSAIELSLGSQGVHFPPGVGYLVALLESPKTGIKLLPTAAELAAREEEGGSRRGRTAGLGPGGALGAGGFGSGVDSELERAARDSRAGLAGDALGDPALEPVAGGAGAGAYISSKVLAGRGADMGSGSGAASEARMGGYPMRSVYNQHDEEDEEELEDRVARAREHEMLGTGPGDAARIEIQSRRTLLRSRGGEVPQQEEEEEEEEEEETPRSVGASAGDAASVHRAADLQPQPEGADDAADKASGASNLDADAAENPFDVSRSPIFHLLQAKGKQADREASKSASQVTPGARHPGETGDGGRAGISSSAHGEEEGDAPTGPENTADDTVTHAEGRGGALQDGELAARVRAQDSGKGGVPQSGEDQDGDDVGKDGELSDTRGSGHDTVPAALQGSAATAAATAVKGQPGQDTTGVDSHPASHTVQRAHPTKQGSDESRSSSVVQGSGSTTTGSGTVTASVDDLLRLLNAARQGTRGGGHGGDDSHDRGGPIGGTAASAGGQQQGGQYQAYKGAPSAASAGPPPAVAASYDASGSGFPAPSRRRAGSLWSLPPAGTPPSAPPADYAQSGVPQGLAGVLLRQQALLARLESQTAAGKQAQVDIGLPTVRSTRMPNDDLLGLLRVRIDGSRVLSVD